MPKSKSSIFRMTYHSGEEILAGDDVAVASRGGSHVGRVKLVCQPNTQDAQDWSLPKGGVLIEGGGLGMFTSANLSDDPDIVLVQRKAEREARHAILADLKSAFPAVRPHRFWPMSNSVLGDETAHVEEDFADKDDWTKLDAAWLDQSPRGLSSALSFLSDEAIRFYIPAYITADLNGLLPSVDPIFQLVHGLDDKSHKRRISPRENRTWFDFARGRWDGLNQNQARVIVQYLEVMVPQAGDYLSPKIAEALGRYWYARAG